MQKHFQLPHNGPFTSKEQNIASRPRTTAEFQVVHDGPEKFTTVRLSNSYV